NLRTKTFWIGILSFPVLLILAVVLPAWLERAKAPRRYAVLDRSGWLEPAVRAQADAEDLALVLQVAVERFQAGDVGLATLPPVLRRFAPALVTLKEDQIRALARRLVRGSDDPTETPVAPEIDQIFQEAGPDLRTWWQGLTPKEAGRLHRGLARSRFVRVEVPQTAGDPAEVLHRMVRQGDLFAYFVIGPDPLPDCRDCQYVSKNLTDTDLYDWFVGQATRVLRARQLADRRIDEALLQWLQASARFEKVYVTAAGEAVRAGMTDTLRQWVPVGFVYLLWISVVTSAQLLLMNTIEEKSSRVIEVLLSSVSPGQLMTGKVLGSALSGLTMVGVWVASLVGLGWVAMSRLGGSLDAGLVRAVADVTYLGPFFVYFLLGYLLYAALLGGLGSVCDSLREAQNLLQPVFFFLIIPLLTMVPIARDPDGTLARLLSYVPPYTPFVMMNRVAGDVPLWEYVTTGGLLVLSVAVAFWAAARVFRVGILMTGQPPRLRDIYRLIRSAGG
ncbi:MAG: ABC transporter permease, partial [Acidobacteria bacterium]|nr:ABC transporter permease [Acidobacteriota bacterium]MDW7984778.1 ABC transporter permease [Acidobacteriota bacterium]